MDKVPDRDPPGSRARHTTHEQATEIGATSFGQDGREHAEPVTEGVQVAHPVDPGMFETRDLNDLEPCLRYPQVDQRLYLEAVAPQPPVAPE